MPLFSANLGFLFTEYSLVKAVYAAKQALIGLPARENMAGHRRTASHRY